DKYVQSAAITLDTVILDGGPEASPTRTRYFPDAFRLVRLVTRSPYFMIEQATAGEHMIADNFCGQSVTGHSGQEHVLWVQFCTPGIHPGRLSIGSGHHHLLDQSFYIPSVIHKVHRQPVQ